MLLAFFVERAFGVEEGIRAAGAGAGVAEDKQVHRWVDTNFDCKASGFWGDVCWFLGGICMVKGCFFIS